jgi:hypothetical protein
MSPSETPHPPTLYNFRMKEHPYHHHLLIPHIPRTLNIYLGEDPQACYRKRINKAQKTQTPEKLFQKDCENHFRDSFSEEEKIALFFVLM